MHVKKKIIYQVIVWVTVLYYLLFLPGLHIHPRDSPPLTSFCLPRINHAFILPYAFFPNTPSEWCWLLHQGASSGFISLNMVIVFKTPTTAILCIMKRPYIWAYIKIQHALMLILQVTATGEASMLLQLMMFDVCRSATNMKEVRK